MRATTNRVKEARKLGEANGLAPCSGRESMDDEGCHTKHNESSVLLAAVVLATEFPHARG